MHEPYFFELWGLPAPFSLCGLRPFKIHAKTSTRGACENQVCSFWIQKGLGCMSHIFFELWGLPALFSLCGLPPFKIHAKTSTRGACENQVCSFWIQKGLGCMSHTFSTPDLFMSEKVS